MVADADDPALTLASAVVQYRVYDPIFPHRDSVYDHPARKGAVSLDHSRCSKIGSIGCYA